MGGTSNYQNISYCIGLIRDIDPKTILDVGVGFGRWGILCREFLEVAGGKCFREEWDIHIDGIEVFLQNIDEYHSYFYNHIYHADAFREIDFLGEYDLIILGDVVEHFEKQKAVIFLNKCLQKGKTVLLNIPIGVNWIQGEVYGNEYERHQSFWELEEFNAFPLVNKKLFKDEAGKEFATLVFRG